MTVKRNVYYYDVQAIQYPPAGGNPIPANVEAIFAAVSKLRALRTRNPNSIRRTGDTNLAVRILGVNSDYITGTFCSMRHDGLGTVIKPDPSGLNEIEEDLTIDPDADLMEASHFVYFRKGKIIGLEFNSQAPRHRMLEWYLKQLAHDHSLPVDEVSLLPKVTHDVIQQLGEIRQLFSLRIKIHRTQAQNIGESTRITKALRASSDLSNNNYTVNLEIKEDGRSSDSIFPIQKDEIAALWINHSDIIEYLIVNESRGDKLNFNSGQMVGKFSVDKIGRRISAASILPQIIDHYEVFIGPHLKE